MASPTTAMFAAALLLLMLLLPSLPSANSFPRVDASAAVTGFVAHYPTLWNPLPTRRRRAADGPAETSTPRPSPPRKAALATSISPVAALEGEVPYAVAESDAPDDAADAFPTVDRRPHEQRVGGPRKARRLNHSFGHLYRHSDPSWDDDEWEDGKWDDDNDDDDWSHVDRTTATVGADGDADVVEGGTKNPMIGDDERRPNPVVAAAAHRYLILHGGYGNDEIDRMAESFPPLLELDVRRHLRPKMRFLKRILGVDEASTLSPRAQSLVPPSFYGARLERTVAPRHAFLVHAGLPSGADLLRPPLDGAKEDSVRSWSSSHGGSSGSLLGDFLLAHRKTKQFAALCNDWRAKYGIAPNAVSNGESQAVAVTRARIDAFDRIFQRGILSAVRDDASTHGRESLMKTANVTSDRLVRLLVEHGANPYETDVRGASLFHWAAGCGNLEGLKALTECVPPLSTAPSHGLPLPPATTGEGHPGSEAAVGWAAERDGATPLHWAAAGAGPKEFGVGGHVDVCAYILGLCRSGTGGSGGSSAGAASSDVDERAVVDARTKDGNTVLMWAAWSRSMSVVKLLVRRRADTAAANRNGCTVAHWAASGGDLDVCKYLVDVVGVDFSPPNHAGNTPLTHAVAYGRTDVVKWLREVLRVGDEDCRASELALNFVTWTGDDERKKVFDLFGDWSEEMGE